jgi:hypothetical protein
VQTASALSSDANASQLIVQTLSAQSELAERCRTPSGETSQAAAAETSAQFNLADLARAFPLSWSQYVLLISRRDMVGLEKVPHLMED